MKKLLIVLDCEDYILEDLNKFDIKEIELYPNTDKVYSYTWEAGFRLLEMPQKKYVDEELAKFCEEYDEEIGYNKCLKEILGEEEWKI